MRANEGDQVLAASGSTALILQVLGADGSPPYVVKWDGTGHISMIVPDQYSQVVPKEERVVPFARRGRAAHVTRAESPVLAERSALP
jgi:hypothetical protein